MMKTSKHLKAVKKQLYKNLFASYRGWMQWCKIKKIKGFGNTAVVLLPACNKETNYLALLYLDQMLKSRGFANAIILTHDSAVMKTAAFFTKKILKVIWLDRKKAEDLMQFYCLYEFDKKFIVASVDEPTGRNGAVLVGKRGTTMEDVFAIGIYRIWPLQKVQPPFYNGDDKEIKQFLKYGEV